MLLRIMIVLYCKNAYAALASANLYGDGLVMPYNSGYPATAIRPSPKLAPVGCQLRKAANVSTTI